MSRELQLEGDLRQAIENYLGEMVGGPWDGVIATMAYAIIAGRFTLDDAGRLSLALANTHGPEKAPDACPTCSGVVRSEGMGW
jgi:hypothetical protein